MKDGFPKFYFVFALLIVDCASIALVAPGGGEADTKE